MNVTAKELIAAMQMLEESLPRETGHQRIYNFGSGNTQTGHELFLKAADLLGLKESSAWILPDEERFADQPRNLTMDCSRLSDHGIHFLDSLEGIEEAIKRPFRY